MLPDPLTSASFTRSVLDYHPKFLPLCTDNLLFHSLCITAESCTIFCLTKAKVFPPLTHSSPSPTAPCLKEVENLQQLLGVSPAEDSRGKCTYQGAQEIPLQLQQVCNMWVVSSCKSHKIHIISTMHRLSIVYPNPNPNLI